MRELTWMIGLALIVAGCDSEVARNDDAGEADAAMADAAMADAAPPQFDCNAMEDEEGLLLCDDFGGGEATGWSAEAGTWEVVAGRYVAHGPMDVDGNECSASPMSAALRDGSEARNVALHAVLESRERVDKAIVLRQTDASNRIEINLRAEPYGDLVVQERVDCEVVFHVPAGEVDVPHDMEQRLDVDVELLDDHLTVSVDGEMVLDRDLALANDGSGRQGLAIIDRSETVFDDVWMFDRD